jgi:uncharacterized protein
MVSLEVRFSGSFVTDRALPATQLDLRRITTPETPLDRLFSADEVREGQDDLRPVGEVAFSGRILRKDHRFQVVGRILASLELECGRCLEHYRFPVDLEVDLTYVPHPGGSVAASEDEVELTNEDLTTAFYRDEVLDLGHLLREQFYLALPMRPLCREACHGLCPQCGANLNTETCGCQTAWQDPRLEGLRGLIDKQDK